MSTINDTVAAISTPFGRGGIAVIRISGKNAIEIADKMFFPKNKRPLSEAKSNYAVYGDIFCDGVKTDDGLATVFRSPRSFTGEDTVEISCHGGILLTERVLKSVFDCGASPAKAGEFSERAFLNGKLSLSEAEGIISLIDAENDESIRLASSHTSGVLKKRIDSIYNEILRLVSSVYVSIDYPDEDLEPVSDEEMEKSLEKILKELTETASTYKRGKAVSEGVKTVLLGKPNTGKSSLLNALTGEEKAIVTDIPGTTRDIIEEKINCGKIILRLYDTAGIRESSDVDKIEQIGIDRALKKAEDAELIIVLFDVSGEFTEDDEKVLSSLRGFAEKGKNIICVLNKNDCLNGNTEKKILSEIGENIIFDPDKNDCLKENTEKKNQSKIGENIKIVSISAKTGEGIDSLLSACEELYAEGSTDYTQTAVLANARQFSAVSCALESVRSAYDGFKNGYLSDICGLDLENALSKLGEIDGRSVAEEVTTEIFRNFCVGK